MTLSFVSSSSVVLLLALLSTRSDFLMAETEIGECVMMNAQNTPKYHLDSACDRMSHNQFRSQMNRYATQKRLQNTGPQRVPKEKTVLCPNSVNDISGGEFSLTGFDMVWLVENTATSPVVVSWVDSDSGIEYSANNPKITPPNADPGAVMEPGTWRTFFTFEGHVFHVRELLEDGSMGNVLMQHRPGLRAITNKYGPEDLYCDPNDPDPEPIVDEVRDPVFARTPPQEGRPCNTIDIGFRNEVGCPVHVFYSGMQGANTTTGESTCFEDFKLHLGINPHPADFLWDWESRTKYEGTFIGHNFVFRLAKDPSIILDQVTLEPTYVTDCPNLKQKDPVKTSMLVTPMGVLRQEKMATNTTASTPLHANHTAFSNHTTPYAPARATSEFYVTAMGTAIPFPLKRRHCNPTLSKT